MKKSIKNLLKVPWLVLIALLVLATFVFGQTPQVKWINGEGGVSEDRANCLAYDVSGNCVITGSYENTVTFGEGEPNETSLTCTGHVDMFVAKYDVRGSLSTQSNRLDIIRLAGRGRTILVKK